MKFRLLTLIAAAIQISVAIASVRDVHCDESYPNDVRNSKRFSRPVTNASQWETNCGEADRVTCKSRCEETVSYGQSFLFASLTICSAKDPILFQCQLLREAVIVGAPHKGSHDCCC